MQRHLNRKKDTLFPIGRMEQAAFPRPMILLGALMFSVSIAFASASIAAEEATEAEKEEQEPVQVAQVEEKASESGSSGSTGNDADEYEATEEISEDLSVSFPVDI
ncbi:hypothetical protein AUP74_01540 [Microbulbifer aggregans]|uniref:Uncharacterized protein n=1 Tax=Microbulbifer aggregans TaxID=1769779 RepID=A0A1C9W749_9GAMM|nr:hypothetical protein [Microbulbifer aggregans]AOS96976.1 hypothetical protein AUP74_01540 [Microbulbifer aggregans]